MSQISDKLPDVIKVLSAIKKDSERKKAMDAIKEEHMKLLNDEVNNRRMKSSELIKEMIKVDIALGEFESNYRNLKLNSEVKEIESINQYIGEIKKYRKKLGRQKNRL